MLTQVSTTQSEQHAAAMLAQVQQHHGPVVIKRDGKPVAALVDSLPLDRLLHAQAGGTQADEEGSLAAQRSRQAAVESIKQWHKRIIGPPMTLEEVIAVRDAGRK